MQSLDGHRKRGVIRFGSARKMGPSMAFGFFGATLPKSHAALATREGRATCRQQRGRLWCTASQTVSSERKEALRDGCLAAVDDYVGSGTNIAIGGSNSGMAVEMAEALATKWETGALMDVSFMATTSCAHKAIQEFGLPMDRSVNPGSGIDVYLSCTSQIDKNLNVSLSEMAHADAECYAASKAGTSVFVVHEADYEACGRNGLSMVPLAIDSMVADEVVRMLTKDEVLRRFGVRAACRRGEDYGEGGSQADATTRSRDFVTVDLLLRREADMATIGHVLEGYTGVQCTGLIRGHDRTVAVVTCADHSYDVGSTLAYITRLVSEARQAGGDERKCLGIAELENATQRANELTASSWVARGASLEATFAFADRIVTRVFAERAMQVMDLGEIDADMHVRGTKVGFRLRTAGAGGVTELDAAVGLEISRICADMTRATGAFDGGA